MIETWRLPYITFLHQIMSPSIVTTILVLITAIPTFASFFDRFCTCIVEEGEYPTLRQYCIRTLCGGHERNDIHMLEASFLAICTVM